MAEYRIRETGEIVTNLAAAFPNVSLPASLSAEDFDALGIDPVFEGPQPELTPPYDVAFRDGVVKIKDQWYTKYSVGPVFEDYTDKDGVEHTAADQLAAYKARLDEGQWEQVRNQRNQKLADSDWTQLPDSPLTNVEQTKWAERRQWLRDVTSQSDPWNIQWEPPAE